jgi:hypothetical protein
LIGRRGEKEKERRILKKYLILIVILACLPAACDPGTGIGGGKTGKSGG